MSASYCARARVLGRVPLVLAVVLLALALVLVPGAGSARANVNNFDFASWRTEIDVTVELAPLGGEVVRSAFTETITARFPEEDQNRGLVRGIPVKMGSQTMRFENLDVTDGDGNPVPFSTSQQHGAADVMIEIGDDNFVHGETTYVIRYDLVNTLRAFDYTDGLQYAPNLVPPFRSQDIEEFSAEVRMPSELWAEARAVPSYRDADDGFEGLDVRCYIDNYGSSERQCALEVETADGVTTIALAASELGDDDVTLDIQFEQDAVQHAGALGALTVWQVLAAAVFLASVVLAVLLVWRYWRRRLNPALTAKGPIVTRYQSNIPPVLAGLLLRDGHTPPHAKTFAASILFAAVRGVLVLGSEAGRNRQQLMVRLERDPAELPAESRAFVRKVLRVAEYGDTRPIYSSDTAMSKRWRDFVEERERRAGADGLIGPSAEGARQNWLLVGALGLVVASYVWVFFAWAHVSEDLMVLPLAGFFVGLAALLGVTFAISAARHAIGLSPEGKQLQLELLGLQQYMSLAEQDRLEMLQGVETAERSDSGENAGHSIINIYEALLPYAELFGLTKSWSQHLEVRYREERYSPTWVPDIGSLDLTQTLNTVRSAAAVRTPHEGAGWGSSDSSSSYSGGGSAGGGFGGGSVGGR